MEGQHCNCHKVFVYFRKRRRGTQHCLVKTPMYCWQGQQRMKEREGERDGEGERERRGELLLPLSLTVAAEEERELNFPWPNLAKLFGSLPDSIQLLGPPSLALKPSSFDPKTAKNLNFRPNQWRPVIQQDPNCMFFFN
jgi:hypothetical protein